MSDVEEFESEKTVTMYNDPSVKSPQKTVENLICPKFASEIGEPSVVLVNSFFFIISFSFSFNS